MRYQSNMASMSTEPRQSVFRFFDFPHEIRQMVYREHFTGANKRSTFILWVCRRLPGSNVTATMAILRTCRQCYQEAKPILFESICFHLVKYIMFHRPTTLGLLSPCLPDQLINILHLRVEGILLRAWPAGSLNSTFPRLKSIYVTDGPCISQVLSLRKGEDRSAMCARVVAKWYGNEFARHLFLSKTKKVAFKLFVQTSISCVGVPDIVSVTWGPWSCE